MYQKIWTCNTEHVLRDIQQRERFGREKNGKKRKNTQLSYQINKSHESSYFATSRSLIALFVLRILVVTRRGGNAVFSMVIHVF